MKIFLKKILISVIIFSLLFNYFIFTGQDKAEAIPVFDAVNANLKAIGNAIDKAWKVWDKFERVHEKIAEFIKAEIKKRIIDTMVDEVINWIQGNGKPKFITDWKSFLSDAANAGVGDVLQEINWGFLCKPLSAQLRLYLAPPPRFSQEVSCTLDDVISNIKDFANDFRNGSWITYEYAWQPENNFYGVYFMATDEMISKIKGNKEAAKAEGQAGGGWLSVKKCIVYAKNKDGTKGKCLKWENTTPGRLVGDMAAKAFGLHEDWIVSSNDIGDYIAAIVDAAINRLIGAGVNGISGISTSSSGGGYSSYRSLPSNIRKIGDQYDQGKSINLSENKRLALKQIDSDLNYRKQGWKSILGSIDTTNNLIRLLKELKSCQESQNLPTKETQAELDKAKTKLNDLGSQKQKTETKIKALENLKSDIEKAKSQEKLFNLTHNLDKFVDPVEAYEFSNLKKKEKENLDKDYQPKIQQTKDDLTVCQNYNLPANQ